MNENIITAIITAIVGIAATLGTIYASRGQIRQHKDEAKYANQKTIFDNALKLHEVYRLENDLLRKRIDELENELHQTKMHCNKIGIENTRLKERVGKLESRLDTGQLTPPPHKVPRDIGK